MNAVKGLLLVACVGLIGSAADAATLTITTNGSNTGAVAVGGTGNVCNPANGGTCVFTIANGTEIRLAANSPATPGVFSAGTGDAAVCGPTSTCKFVLSTDSSIVATFNAGSYPSLQIILAGDGKGEVSPDNNRCQNFELGYSACTTFFAAGSEVTMQARSMPGNIFTSFSGGTVNAAGCGATNPCVFTLMANSTVTANFSALASVAVQPGTATRNVGQTQSFGATGTFSNGATRSLQAGPGMWGSAMPMSSARYGVAAGVLNQRVYVIGGVTAMGPLNKVEAYDPVSGTWTTNFQGGGPLATMPTPRESLAAVVVGTELYALGGHTSGGSAVATVEAYDAITNAWTTRAPMPTIRAALAAGAVDGVLYAVGGGENGAELNTLEAYDPGSNTWTTRAPMPTPRRYLAVAVVGGLLYAIGGDSAGTVEAYDPATNTWTTKAPLPTPRSALVAGAIDGLIYAVGGQRAGTSNVAEVYNPATDRWTSLASMPTARDEAALGVLDGRLFIAGGKTSPTGDSLIATLETFRPPETTWWTSDTAVATINQTGTATAVAGGSATITARAVGVGCATSSGCATLTVNGGAPGAPGAPVVSGSGNLVTFNWTPANGSPTVYTLVARMTVGGPIVASIPVGNATSFSVTAPNGTFVISVQASNAFGTGPESPGVTVSVPVIGTLAGAPQNLAVSFDAGTATLTWTPPTSGGAPTGYRVVASLIPGGTSFASLTLGNVTSLVIPGVPSGVFYLRVIATNAAGEGPTSNEVVLNAAGCTLPTAPQGLTAGYASGVATVSWSPVSGAASYTLFVQPGGGGAFSPAATLVGTTISAPVGPPLDVWVSVTATNACGASPMSPPQRLTIP